MKLDRTQFKKVLKECMRELIDEGAFSNVMKESNFRQEASNERPAANDFVASSQVGNSSPNDRLKEISRAAAAQISKGDPKSRAMMESIFEDTARTTWQRQMEAERGGTGQDEVYVGDETSAEVNAQEMAMLDVLSGGRGAQHWAAVALGKTNK